MVKKFAITPDFLLTIGETIGKLQCRLDQSTAYWSVVSAHLRILSIFKDAENIESIGKEADKWHSDLDLSRKYLEENAYLDYVDHKMLKETVTRWEERLREFSKNWVLSYLDTHIDAAKLAEGSKAFLSDDEFSMLEPLEEQSLRETTSSLLFANFTSAEFMALRTAESLLKRWYEKKTSKKLGKTTWGEVLEKLNQEFPKKEERPKELLLLDYLRERRNEIAHSEAVSNSVQASTTFFNVISLCQTLYFKHS